MRIVNGHLGLDKGQGNFTYQSVLGKSIIDYVLIPPEMFIDVTQFVVHDIFTFSDHAPLQMSFKTKHKVEILSENQKINKIIWDSTTVDSFRNILSDSLIDLDLLVDRIVNENLNVDDGIENFGSVLYNSAYSIFGKTVTVKSGQSSSPRKYNSPWFNNECEIARVELKRANKEFRKHRYHMMYYC